MKLGCTTLRLAVAGLLTLTAVTVASTALVGPAGAQPAPAAASSAAPASAPGNGAAMPGKQVFQDVCGSCHDLTVSTDQTKSHDEWQATVSRMAEMGAPLSEEQSAQVVDYLTKTHGAK